MTTDLYKMDGPILILASPGTGKTYCLAQRIKYLVEDAQVDPDQIMVVTFTNAAAANMRIRISKTDTPDLFISPRLQPKTICTIHGLGHRIISEKASDFGLRLPIAVVWSDFTRQVLMEDASQLAGFSRSEWVNTNACRQNGNCLSSDDPKCQICEKYRNILRACGAIDHDDQVLLAYEVLKKDPHLCSKYSEKATHLLVDEYQDINMGQYKLIKLLSNNNPSGLFVVGDDDQSIYSWRGGSPKFIRNFEKHFGVAAKVKALRHSYRCPRNILEGSIEIVRAYDQKRRDKGKLTYEVDEGSKIKIHNVPSDKREALIVRGIIENAQPSKQVLVLIPHRGYASLIVNQLRQAKIDYVAPEPLPGEGLPVLERLVAWLNNANDSLAFRECLESIMNSKLLEIPSKRVKRADRREVREKAFALISRLWRAAIKKNISLWESLESDHGQHNLLNSINNCFKEIRAFAEENNLPEFLKLTSIAIEPWGKTNSLMEEIDAWVRRFRSSSRFGGAPIAQIMTFQGAKGLEADTVCVIGLEQGTIPGHDSNEEKDAENSRLMFVSMTRARNELHLFHARKRSGAVSYQSIHASGKTHTLRPSVFLDEISKDYAEKIYHQAKN